MSAAEGTRHGPGPDGSPSVAGALLASVASGEPADVARALAAVRSAVEQQPNPAMAAMLVAAEEVLSRWRSNRVRAEASWAEHQQACLAEGENRRRTMAILRAMAQLTAPDPSERAESELHVTGADATHSEPDPHPWAGCDRQPAAASSIELAACLFGSFRMFRGGRSMPSWPGAKTARLLCHLVAHRGRTVHRELLTELFWPDIDPEQARRNLHQAVYVIRKALRTVRDAPDFIIYDNDCYAVNHRLGLWCDVDQFEALIGSGRSAERQERADDAIAGYEHAVSLYVGDYLQDQPYEEWACAERDRLRLLYLDGSNHLAELRLTRGEVDIALELTEGVLRREPCDEVAHRRALRCHAATGNRAFVVRHFRRYTDTLRECLSLGPSAETEHLYHSLVK